MFFGQCATGEFILNSRAWNIDFLLHANRMKPYVPLISCEGDVLF